MSVTRLPLLLALWLVGVYLVFNVIKTWIKNRIHALASLVSITLLYMQWLCLLLGAGFC